MVRIRPVEDTLQSSSRSRSDSAAKIGGTVLGALWVSIALGVGWALGFFVDRLRVTPDRRLAMSMIIACLFVLTCWAYGSWLLTVEVRAGIEELSTSEPRHGRTGYRTIALVASPIIGLLIGISSSGSPGHGMGSTPPAITALAPKHATHTGSPRDRTVPFTTSYTVQPGDSLTAIAEHYYGSAADWPRLARANAGRLHEGARLIDPSVLPVGLQLTVPDALNTAPKQPSTPRHLAPPVGATTNSSIMTTRQEELFGVLAGFGFVGASLLSRRLLRNRALQPMRRRWATRPPLLDEKDARIEAYLRPLDAAELPEWIDAANRLLCAALSKDRQIPTPRIGIVRAGPSGIELLLEEPAMIAAPGFLVAHDGRSWRLDPRLELDDLRASTPDGTQPYLAVLVPIAEDGSGSYLVACAPGESVALIGNADEVARALGAVVAQLAHAPWAEVKLYGMGSPTFVGHEVLEMVETSQFLHIGREENKDSDTLWRVGLVEPQPLVLLQASPHDPARSAVQELRGSISVMGTVDNGDRLLIFEDGFVTIEPLGLHLPALLPSSEELRTASRLRQLGTNEHDEPTHGRARPSSIEAHSANAGGVEASNRLPEPAAVEVRLLRPLPDIKGHAQGASVSADVVELIAYVALHDGTSSIDRLSKIFLPYGSDTGRARDAIHRVVECGNSILRGARLVVDETHDRVTLHGDVSCDWKRFATMADHASAQLSEGDLEAAVVTLQCALSLVGEGAPASDPSIAGHYLWLDSEQILQMMEMSIVTSASTLALLLVEHRLRSSGLEDAEWAIAKGRAVSPNERSLREVSMLLAEARHDLARVESEYRAAVRAVDDLGAGEVDDNDLENLFHSIVRASRI